MSSILNSNDEIGDFGLLENTREDKEARKVEMFQPILEIRFFPRNHYKCLQDGDIRSPLVVVC